MKIPKILHFIWFGSELPDYAKFSIENFRNVNPDFEINLVQRNKNEIDNIIFGNTTDVIDNTIKKSIKRILSFDSFVNFQLTTIYINGIKLEQILADVVRIELLNEFGGIYLDCDTFPRKPFDENILNNDFFIVKRSQNGGMFRDNFFMGKMKNNHNIINPYTIEATEIDHDFDLKTDLLWKKKKFFECNLKYEEKNDGYIYHFENGGWKYGVRKRL